MTATQTHDHDQVAELAAPSSGTKAESRADPGTSDVRTILRLQSTAGNRAVSTLIREAALIGRGTLQGPRPGATGQQPVQRFWGDEELNPTPEEPIPGDYEPPTVQWPSNDAQGERNEPCFAPESQVAITDGVMHADLAAAALTKMPPDIGEAVAEISQAQVPWGEQKGSPEPGNGALQAAYEKISGAQERIGIYVVPVADILKATATATEEAAADARTASNLETENGPDGEPAEQCFEDQQQSMIKAAAEDAEKGAAMLDKRPPDYEQAIDTIRGAADKLAAVGGRAPGQTRLTEAVNQLKRVTDALEAYLTPVAKVLADAAADIQAASTAASDAKDMSIRGEFAPPPEAPPPEAPR